MKTRTAHASARAVAALGLTVAACTAGAGPAGAAAQPMGRCTTSSGVVLAVDFGHWGGPVHRSCGTTPTTGYELLNQGGWATTGTGHDGPAFVCRIGYSGHRGGQQYPTPREDDCVLTPPASAYWSYWHAGPGDDTWEYSRLGAMRYEPEPGSVDLWVFGGTDVGGSKGRPTISPDRLRAHNERPTGGSKPASPPGSQPAPGKTPEPKKAGTPAPTATGRAPDRPPAASSPSASASVSTSASASVSASGSARPSPSATRAAPGEDVEVVDAAPAADAEHDAGSFLPAVATAALVLAIGAGGVYAARRRRRTE